MFGILWALALGQQIEADPVQLARIDRDFMCPENLPDDEARISALAKFDADVARAVKDLTIEQLGDVRMYLLRKHRCTVTLKNIERADPR